MKEECALVSYCCKISDTEKKQRREILDDIAGKLDELKAHECLEALNTENKNVFLIRNSEFGNFKLGKFIINESDKKNRDELASKVVEFFDKIHVRNSCYIELTPFGISIYAKFRNKVNLDKDGSVFGKHNLSFCEAGYNENTNDFVIVAPTNISCANGDLIFKSITHKDLREFVNNEKKRIYFSDTVDEPVRQMSFDTSKEFIVACYNAYMFAKNNEISFALESGEIINTINPFTNKKLVFTEEQTQWLLENRSDFSKLMVICREILKQSNFIYDVVTEKFYDENCESYTKETVAEKIITMNSTVDLNAFKKRILSELISYERYGIEKSDICKMLMEKRMESVKEYTYSIEKFCARVGFDLYETENMKRVLCALVQKQLNPEAVFQQTIYFVSKRQGTGKTLFWQAIGKELNPIHPYHAVSASDQPRDLAAFARETPLLMFDEANLLDSKFNNFLNKYTSDEGIAYRKLYTHETAMAIKRSVPVVLANHISGAVLFNEQIGCRRPWVFDFSRNDVERNTFKAFHYKKSEPKNGKVTAKDLINDACFIVKQMMDNPDFECGDNPDRKVYTELRNKYYMDSDSLDCQVELRLHDIIDYAHKHKDLFYWHKTKTGGSFPAICLTPQKWAQLLHDGYVSGIDTKQKGDKADDDVFKYSSIRFASVSLSVKTIINRILVKFPTGYNDPKTMCDLSCGYRKSFRGIPIWELLNEFQNQIMKPKPEKYVYRGSCYDYEKDYVYVTDDGEVFERDDSENKFFDEDVVEYDCLKVKYDKDLMDKKCECVETHKTESNKNNDDFCKNNQNDYADEPLHKNELSDLCKQIEKKETINETTKFDTVVDYLQNIILINQKNCELISEIKNIKDVLSDDERDILHEILSQHNEEYSDMIFDVDLDVKRQEELNF